MLQFLAQIFLIHKVGNKFREFELGILLKEVVQSTIKAIIGSFLSY